MPIIRRALTVAAVAAVGTITIALPAWAHTGAFTRDCTQVHMHLTNFQASQDKPNVVDVFRDGTKIDTVNFNTTSTDKDYQQTPDAAVTYEAKWYKTGPDMASGDQKVTLQPVENCDEQPPPATGSPTPTATMPVPTKSVVAPVSSPSAPAATPSKAVEADKLANTGAGNTVPLLVVGTVLVAGGVGLTFVTRRRRSGSTTS